MPGRSITLRLALYFSIASTAILLSGGYVVGRLVDSHLLAQDHATLEGKLELVQSVLARARAEGDLSRASGELSSALVGHHDLFVQIVDREGRTLYASPGLDVPRRLLEPQMAGSTAKPARSIVWEQDGSRYRGLVAPVLWATPDDAPLRAVVALNIDFHGEFMTEFRNSLWFAVAVGIVLSALLGWISARHGLAPARRMLRLTQRISADRLGERLPPASVPLELEDLAVAFNDMLARLEDSFRRLLDFSSDLAHELRTPIANLMTQTQVALSRARTADEYREILYSNLEEYERLAHMTSDMLFLAKADNGLIATRGEAVDLAVEMRQLFAFYEALCEERGIRLSLEGSGEVRADRDMLRRAISNLLSNAIRHTPRGGEIRATISPGSGGQVELGIENPGEPIASAHLARLFDRFYRIDASRRNEGEGAGLGLAITKSIIEAHGGAIRATSANGTVRFAFTVPPG